MTHEVGHTLGLEHNLTYDGGPDNTTEYCDPSGVMSNKSRPPTLTDLKNVLNLAMKRLGKANSIVDIDEASLKKFFPGYSPETDPRPSNKDINVKK